MSATAGHHNVFEYVNALLKLNNIDYSTACDSVELTPSYSKNLWKGINGVSKSSAGAASWVMNLNFGQDWETSHLMEFLYTNHGKEVDFSLEPQGAGSNLPSVKGKVLIVMPSKFGGKVGETQTATVALDVSGVPVVKFAPAGA